MSNTVLLPPSQVAGFYRVRAYHPGASAPYFDAPWHPNLVLDSGLELLGANTITGASDHLQFGTDNTPPSVAQSNLVAPVGSRENTISSTTNSNSGGVPVWYHDVTRTWECSVDSLGIAGLALAEMAFFGAISGGDAYARVLIRDALGDPTTVTPTAGDIIFVDYTVRLYPPTADNTGTITIGGAVYDWVTRAANIDTTNRWSPSVGHTVGPNFVYARETQTLGSLTGSPSGTIQPLSGSADPYVPGSLQKSVSASAGIGVANFTNGIGTITVSCVGGPSDWYQISFSRQSDGFGIAKTATRIINLDSFFTIGWGRY